MDLVQEAIDMDTRSRSELAAARKDTTNLNNPNSVQQMKQWLSDNCLETDTYTLSPNGIQARLEELQKELIKKANHKQDYDAIADEIFRLRGQKEKPEVYSHSQEEAMNRIKELQDFISQQKT